MKSSFTEEWKSIKGYEGIYQISNKGKIKSHNRIVINKNGIFIKYKGKIMKTGLVGNYLQVGLYKDNKRIYFYIHNLVGKYFTPFINNLIDFVYDHKDNNSLNNFYTNIQMISNRENLSKDKKNKTSKYTGVYLIKKLNTWGVKIVIEGKRYYLGSFESEEDASKAYQNKLKEINNNSNPLKV